MGDPPSLDLISEEILYYSQMLPILTFLVMISSGMIILRKYRECSYDRISFIVPSLYVFSYLFKSVTGIARLTG